MKETEKKKGNKSTTVLVVIASIVLIVLIILLGYNWKQKKRIDILKSQIEKQDNAVASEDDIISYLTGEPEDYLYTLCLWTKKELPTFSSINSSDAEWLWTNMVGIMNDMDEKVVNYEKIAQYANIIYGDNFTNEFPKEGGYGLVYDAETNQYKIEKDMYDYGNIKSNYSRIGRIYCRRTGR